MHYVYVLQSEKTPMLYIGYTPDLKKRLIGHNSGNTEFTAKYRPWSLVYYEVYRDKRDAQKREKMLKQYGASLGQLKKRIKFSLCKTLAARV